MNQRKTTVERAFEIATLGTYVAVDDICAQLNRKGYSCEQLDGPSIRKQLRQIARKARSESGPQYKINAKPAS